MVGKFKLLKKGFTLIEVLVSVSLFSVIIVSVAGIFKLAIDGQRAAIATQNVQESLKYFLEVTAKEIRMAKLSSGGCADVPSASVFKVASNGNNDALYFKNYYDECVEYYLDNYGDSYRFKISRRGTDGVTRTDFISPAKIKINNLHFVLSGTASSSQPIVTINLNATAVNDNSLESNMTIQTSIASRYYK